MAENRETGYPFPTHLPTDGGHRHDGSDGPPERLAPNVSNMSAAQDPSVPQGRRPSRVPTVHSYVNDGYNRFMFPPNRPDNGGRQRSRRMSDAASLSWGSQGPPRVVPTTTNGSYRWIDEEYQHHNPWYGQERIRPVFSLGTPLPRTVRARRAQQEKQEKQEKQGKQGKQDKQNKQGRQDKARPGNRQETNRQDIVPGDVEQGVLGADPRPPTIKERNSSDGTLPAGFEERDFEPQRQTWRDDPDQVQGSETARRFKIDGDPVGQAERDEVLDGEAEPNDLRNYWARFRAKYPEPFAEFLCTGMSVFLGVAVTLSVNLSAGQSNQYGSYETICWAWGLSFMFGIYLGGGVSGAHMNPAISICLWIFRGFPWRHCGLYIVVQFLASIAGGGLALGLYRDAILQVDPTLTTSYASWFSVPQPWVSVPTAFFTEFVAGAIMMIAVLSLGDDENNPPGAGMHAFILGLLVTVLKFTLGYNTGASMSPSTDLGLRLVALWAGYNTEHLFQTGYWVYGPWVATLTGSMFGCSLYDSFVFVGSESPINYRWTLRKRDMKLRWRTLRRRAHDANTEAWREAHRHPDGVSSRKVSEDYERRARVYGQ